LALVGLVLGAWGAYVTVNLRQARDDLAAGRAALTSGTTGVLDGDLDASVAALAEAADRFSDAESRLTTPPVRILEIVIPVVGRNVEVVRVLASTGNELGRDVLAVAEALGGEDVVATVAPRDGGIPLDPLRAVGSPLAALRDTVVTARADLEELPRTLLVPQVAGARQALADELAARDGQIATAAALAEVLPGFFGGQGQRRYLVGAQDPAEIRGSGGYLGAVSVLQADDGRLALSAFTPLQDLPVLPQGTVPPPTEDYGRRYARYGGASFFPNINFSPDVPSSAAAAAAYYELAGGPEVDGAILVTPGALAALAQGPVEIPGIGSLAPDQIERYLTHDAFIVFESDQLTRKRVLGDVARAVLDQFLSGQGDPVAAARALGQSVADGEIFLYSGDEMEQAAFVEAGVAGALPSSRNDVLGVYLNSLSAGKVDYYLEMAISHRAVLAPDGRVEATTEVVLRNDAPTSGEPAYILSPLVPGYLDGDALLRIDLACPATCEVEDAEADARPLPYRIEEERDLAFAVAEVLVPGGGGQTVATFASQSSDAWRRTDEGVRYELTLSSRPLVRPTMFDVEVAIPEGLVVADSTGDAEVTGGVVRWTGTLSGDRTVRVDFVAI